MTLELLRQSSHIRIYYDSYNNWLFVDWQGEVDMAAAQAACLDLAYIYLNRPYHRVLLSTMQVSSVDWRALAWLAKEVLPYLSLAGIEQMACVSGRSARGHAVLQEVVNRLLPLPIAIFDDLEIAVNWLQRTRPLQWVVTGLPSRPPATEAKFHQVVMRLTQMLDVQQTLPTLGSVAEQYLSTQHRLTA